MIMKVPILDDRLYLAASFVREGRVFADIGTDHAYIPIFLINTGKNPAALACDINEGPLERAKEHAEKYGCTKEISFYLADGLSGLPLKEKNVTDIVICGMGGELIADIIKESDYVKNPNVRLILQPMTKPEKLREYLSSAGFKETDSGAVTADGKPYQCMVYTYTGEPYELSEIEKLLGTSGGIKKSESYFALLGKYIKMTEKKLKGPEKEKAEILLSALRKEL